MVARDHHSCRTLAATEHNRAATRTIERAWKTHAHPQLAQIIRRQAANPLDALNKPNIFAAAARPASKATSP